MKTLYNFNSSAIYNYKELLRKNGVEAVKRRVDLSTEEIQEIFECVNEHERKELAEFLVGGNAVLASGEAVGEHSFYGAAVEVVVDKEFSD